MVNVKKAMREFLNTEERKVLYQAFSAPFVQRQIDKALAGHPKVAKAVNGDFENRIVFGYQMWLGGQLDIGPKTKTVFQTMHDSFFDLAGIATNGQQNQRVMDALHDNLQQGGTRDPFLDVLAKPLKKNRIASVIQTSMKAWEHISPMLEHLPLMGMSRMMDTGIPALQQIASLIKHRPGDEHTGTPAMLQEKRESISRFFDKWERAQRGLDATQKIALLDALHNPNKQVAPELEARRQDVYKYMREMHDYMREAMPHLGDQGPTYFPWVFDAQYMGGNKHKFIMLLQQPQYAAKIAEIAAEWGVAEAIVPARIAQHIIDSEGVAETYYKGETGTPYMHAINARSLEWIERLGNATDKQVLSQFFNKDLDHTVVTYIREGVKRTEFERAFGRQGTKLQKMLDAAREQGATDEQVQMAHDFIDGAMGTLGMDTNARIRRFLGQSAPRTGEVINPTLQGAMSTAMVITNMAVLGLSTISSLADPVGIAVRGGGLHQGLVGLKAGFKEVMSLLKGTPESRTAQMARMYGVLEEHANAEALEWELGSPFLKPGLRRANDMFFKVIGLTQWTRLTRLMAFASAKDFIVTHKDGSYNKHSERWMRELGLSPQDVVLDARGELALMTHAEREVASVEERARDDKVRRAINKYVDECIMRPDASQRPIRANDPHYMLFFHLKSFMYSFHDNVLRRVMREVGEQNFVPLLLLMCFVPFTMAADLLRQLLQGGYKAGGTGMENRVSTAVERSGLYGMGQMIVDAHKDVQYGGLGYESLLGPDVDMLKRLPKLVYGNDQQRWHEFERDLPGSNVWRHWLHVKKQREEG
jgi:hypothetical protein